MSTKPFTDLEIIEAVRIKFGDLRNEVREAEQKMRSEMRAEMLAEIAKLRTELSEPERGTTKRLKAPPALIAGRAN